MLNLVKLSASHQLSCSELHRYYECMSRPFPVPQAVSLHDNICNAVVLAALACLPAQSALQLYGFNWSPGHWPRHDVAAEARAIAGLQTAGLLRVHPTPCHGAPPTWLLLLLLQLVPVRRVGLVHNVCQCQSWTNTLTACGLTRIATQGVLQATFADEDVYRPSEYSSSCTVRVVVLYSSRACGRARARWTSTTRRAAPQLQCEHSNRHIFITFLRLIPAGLRACVRKLDVNCKASRAKCWVAPTAYLRDAVHAIGEELHRRGLAAATGADFHARFTTVSAEIHHRRMWVLLPYPRDAVHAVWRGAAPRPHGRHRCSKVLSPRLRLSPIRTRLCRARERTDGGARQRVARVVRTDACDKAFQQLQSCSRRGEESAGDRGHNPDSLQQLRVAGSNTILFHNTAKPCIVLQVLT